MRKLGSILAILFIFSIFLVACGETTEEAPGTGEETPGQDDSTPTEEENGTETGAADDLVVLTGGEQGTYFPLGGALAQIITSDVEGLTATAVTTGASVVNIRDLVDGLGDLALVQNDVAYYAVEGIHNFEGETIEGFSGIASLYPEVVQIVAAADSGISSVDDLRGKSVAVGDQGSGAEINARQILEAHDITYADIQAEYMSFGDASGGIQDGNIDAAFITGGVPTAAIESLKASKDITIVSIAPDKIAELTGQYPYYTEFELAADVYNTEAAATTVAVQAILVVNQSMSDDQVYEITKAMFENLDVFQNTHTRGHDITIETAKEGMSIDLHPGAQRYFDEVE